jgi:coatomer protein complex subunit epsilon
MTTDPDELWSMRNQFYVGNYDACISEGEMARVEDKPALITQRDLFTYRALLAKREYNTVAKKTKDATLLEFKALNALALVLDPSTPQSTCTQALTTLKSAVEQDASGNEQLRVLAGIAFAHTGDLTEALRALRAGPGSPSLESFHVQVLIYLRMNRPDAAKRALEVMQTKDEDSTLTQLASAWVAIGVGGETNYKDAVYVFHDLIGKWQPTPLLVGGLASGLLHQGHVSEAQKALDEVAKQYPADATIAFDRLVSSYHAGGKHSSEYLEALRKIDPKHKLFSDLQGLDQAFDTAAATFKQQ